MSKILIAYFSRTGENYVNDSVVDLARGNTFTAAEYIAEAVGGELFEIDTAQKYPDDYYKCIEQAKEELNSSARPELKEYKDISGYDVIFIGYPNWWGTAPMAVFSFLEQCDLSGKTIAPFCTNEGSGMGSSERDLRRVCTGANVESGLSIIGSDVGTLKDAITEWAKRFDRKS